MEYKIGTSFDFTGVVKDDATGQVKDITGWGVESQLRTKVGGRANELIATLVGTVENGLQGIYRVKAATIAETLTWVLGEAVFDIVFVTPADDRVPTEGFFDVKIIAPSTQAAAP